MTKDSLIAQLTFELYEIKARMERIRHIADNGNREGDLIDIVNICDLFDTYED